MATINDFGNGVGKIYVRGKINGVPLTPTDNIALATFDNNKAGVLAALADGLTSSTVTGSGYYDAEYGRLYFLYPDASAPESISGADIQIGVNASTIVDISNRVIKQGLESHIDTYPSVSIDFVPFFISNLTRNAIITQIYVNINGANTIVKTITPVGHIEGDILIIRGGSVANPITVETRASAPDNIFLANGETFTSASVAGQPNCLVLQYRAADLSWYEVSRTPSITLSVANLRAAGIPQPVSGVNSQVLPPTISPAALVAGTDKGMQIFTGSPTLTTNISITGTATIEGDTFLIDYRATPVTGGTNTVNIFGVTLTDRQATGAVEYNSVQPAYPTAPALLAARGRVLVKAVWTGSAWQTTVISDFTNIDLATRSYVDKTFEPYLARPAFNNAFLTSDTLGVRSWSYINMPVQNVLYVNPLGDDTDALADVVANYSILPTPVFGNSIGHPFKTLTAAAAAADIIKAIVAANINADNRILIEASPSHYLEFITLKNYIDYNLLGSTVENNTTTGHTITDGNVTSDGRIYGYPTIKRSGISVSPITTCINIQNTSSSCVMYLGNIINNANGGSAIIVVLLDGTSILNCNDITNNGTAVTSVTVAFPFGGSKLYCSNIINSVSGIGNTGSTTLTMGTGSPYARCSDIVNNSQGGTSVSGLNMINGKVDCGDITVRSGTIVSSCIFCGATNTANVLEVNCNNLINESTNVTSDLISMDNPASTLESGVLKLVMLDGTMTGTTGGSGSNFIALDGDSQAFIKCRKINMTGIPIRTYTTSSVNAKLEIECDEILTTTDDVTSILGAASVRIQGRIVSTFAGKTGIVNGTAGTVIIKDLEIVTNAGASASGAFVIKAYGLCVANNASSTGGNIQVQNDGVQVTAGEFVGVADVV